MSQQDEDQPRLPDDLVGFFTRKQIFLPCNPHLWLQQIIPEIFRIRIGIKTLSEFLDENTYLQPIRNFRWGEAKGAGCKYGD